MSKEVSPESEPQGSAYFELYQDFMRRVRRRILDPNAPKKPLAPAGAAAVPEKEPVTSDTEK